MSKKSILLLFIHTSPPNPTFLSQQFLTTSKIYRQQFPKPHFFPDHDDPKKNKHHMGICSSCESTNVATAKLILLDGRLQEFPYPVKASYVLADDPTCFICNSDEMEFDDVVPAVEELQLGGLYFALPVTKMKRRLQAEEMAALAVKASSALMKPCGGYRRCRCRKKVVDFPVVDRDRDRDRVEVGRRRTVGATGCGDGGGNGRRRKFEASLASIPE